VRPARGVEDALVGRKDLAVSGRGNSSCPPNPKVCLLFDTPGVVVVRKLSAEDIDVPSVNWGKFVIVAREVSETLDSLRSGISFGLYVYPDCDDPGLVAV